MYIEKGDTVLIGEKYRKTYLANNRIHKHCDITKPFIVVDINSDGLCTVVQEHTFTPTGKIGYSKLFASKLNNISGLVPMKYFYGMYDAVLQPIVPELKTLFEELPKESICELTIDGESLIHLSKDRVNNKVENTLKTKNCNIVVKYIDGTQYHIKVKAKPKPKPKPKPKQTFQSIPVGIYFCFEPVSMNRCIKIGDQQYFSFQRKTVGSIDSTKPIFVYSVSKEKLQ